MRWAALHRGERHGPLPRRVPRAPAEDVDYMDVSLLIVSVATAMIPFLSMTTRTAR